MTDAIQKSISQPYHQAKPTHFCNFLTQSSIILSIEVGETNKWKNYNSKYKLSSRIIWLWLQVQNSRTYTDSPIPPMAAKETISTKWLDSRYINSERTKLFWSQTQSYMKWERRNNFSVKFYSTRIEQTLKTGAKD